MRAGKTIEYAEIRHGTSTSRLPLGADAQNKLTDRIGIRIIKLGMRSTGDLRGL